MKFDEIIPLLGNFSRYQIFMVGYMCIVSTIGCLTTLSNVFFAAETDHWCKVLPDENCSSWAEFQDNCTEVKKSIFLPPPEKNDSGYPYSNCEQWDLPADYVFNPFMPLNEDENYTYHEVSCKDGWEYDTSQYKTTIITDFDLVCDRKSLPSLAQCAFFLGFLVGSVVGGALSDWIGRKKIVIVGLISWVVGAVVTTFSVNIYMYMAFRFTAAFGFINVFIALYILVIEVVGTSWRTVVTMLLGTFFALGYFIMAVTAMHVKEWRTLSLILSLATVPLFIPLPLVQESISWLISKRRHDEAEAVIRKVAKMNKKTLPNILFDEEILQELTESKGSAVPPSVIDLYRTPNMAVKTLNLQYNWFVNCLVYYGLSQSTGDLGVDDYWAFFVSGAVEIPARIYATVGVEWLGRKWNTAILELIGGVACIATIFSPVGIWRTAVSMVGKFCISATFGIMYLYSSELFPTPVRAVGLGVCSGASRVGGILSPIILLMGAGMPSLPLILFGLSSVLAGILVLLLPETRGQKLPQTMKEGEEIGKCQCMEGRADDQSHVQHVYTYGAITRSSQIIDFNEETKEDCNFSPHNLQ